MLSKVDAVVAETVKRLKEERGLSLRQLEELTGVSHATIDAFLSRGHAPKSATIAALAEALGFRVSIPDGRITVLRTPREKVPA